MDLWLGILLALLCLFLIGVTVERLMEQSDRRRFPPPGRLVPVGNRRLHVMCSGERRQGEPLVVMEAGMASWSFYWRLVQPEIARFARVCSYDRFGLGWSDPAAGLRNPQRIAADLHQALQLAGESPPYLLVGHSLGGIFVRQFARMYPDEVYGMVLVDSAHEDQIERMPWARNEAKNINGFFTFLALLHRVGILRLLGKSVLARFTSLTTPEEKRIFLATLLASRYFETSRNESASLLTPVPPTERLLSFDEKPLIIIQAGGQPESLPRGYTQDRWAEQRRAWDEIQRDLLKLSTNSRLVVAEKSVHAVQLEQPEVVINSIKHTLERQP